jgi:hypothetical protein
MTSNLPSQFRKQEEFVRAMVEERFERLEEFGEHWDDKPVRRPTLDTHATINQEKQNDMLMWLMSEAEGVEKSLKGFARRLLMVNFAAIFTTSLVSHADLLMDH